MNKLNDHEDEKVDVLVRKALREETKNINAPDRIKKK